MSVSCNILLLFYAHFVMILFIMSFSNVDKYTIIISYLQGEGIGTANSIYPPADVQRR